MVQFGQGQRQSLDKELIIYCAFHDKVLKSPKCECKYNYMECWYYLIVLPSQFERIREIYRRKHR